MPHQSSPALQIRFTPLAATDLDEAFAYIDARNATAARELLADLRERIERLSRFPELGVLLSPEEYVFIEPGIRFITVEPYIVFYRIGAADVMVMRILHSRRDALGELLG